MAMLMKKNLKAYEEQFQVQIPLPRQIMNQMGLSNEDW
jgi:hypothetical protein